MKKKKKEKFGKREKIIVDGHLYCVKRKEKRKSSTIRRTIV